MMVTQRMADTAEFEEIHDSAFKGASQRLENNETIERQKYCKKSKGPECQVTNSSFNLEHRKGGLQRYDNILRSGHKKYKRYNIVGVDWGEDVASMNAVSKKDEELGEPKKRADNEYWEDLNKHSEPDIQDSDENNLMYKYDEDDKHNENDIVHQNKNFYDEQSEQHGRLDNQPDDMTMRGLHSYHTTAKSEPNEPKYEFIPQNDNMVQPDDFESDSFAERKEHRPHKLKDERDREDYAFVHGVDVNDALGKEGRTEKKEKETKYLEDDFDVAHETRGMPQKYESVSNEYRLPTEPHAKDLEMEKSAQTSNNVPSEQVTTQAHLTESDQDKTKENYADEKGVVTHQEGKHGFLYRVLFCGVRCVNSNKAFFVPFSISRIYFQKLLRISTRHTVSVLAP